MEPCLFRHGKDKAEDYGIRHFEFASMEPCLFRHGKGPVILNYLNLVRFRFNGAMSFQTW